MIFRRLERAKSVKADTLIYTGDSYFIYEYTDQSGCPVQVQ